MSTYNKPTQEQWNEIEKILINGGTKVGAAIEVLGSKTRESTIRNALARGDISASISEASELISKLKDDMCKMHKELEKETGEEKEVKTSRNGKISYTVPDIPPIVEREFDNSRILVISDLHIPYHHVDALEFLAYLAEKYSPTRVICLGDELDKHAMSFHASDPDLKSAGDELKASLPIIKELQEMFPLMDILDSNHGSMVWRKAKIFGIPKHYIRSYNEVLEVHEGWQWHHDMTIKLPNGNHCYFHHGKSANTIQLSQQMGMCCVQGHYHESFNISYWGNQTGLYWAMQAACLIDDKSYAFSYNNINIKRPIIGTGLIIDSLPVLEPMVLDEDGRWVGRKV